MSESIMAKDTFLDMKIYCSIIIPTKDRYSYLKQCIESIQSSNKSEYLEIIIVDNQSIENETLDYLEALKQRENIQVLSWSKPFNYSAINNYAAKKARSEILCFANNDVEISDKNWLTKMMPLVRREDVGAVGCILLYPNSRIQHAGIALEESSIAKHIALNEDSDYLEKNNILGPFPVDCATAAFLLIERNIFLKLGGFNENYLSVAYNDVDLCLKMSEKGLVTLIEPNVKLLHHESITRGSDDLPTNRTRAVREFNYIKYRWRHRLVGKRYNRGIPVNTVNLLKESHGELDKLIELAADSMYKELQIEDKYFFSAPKPTQEKYQTHAENSHLSNWELKYSQLFSQYSELEAHTNRLENAHLLIERSLFWKITWPLRVLRDSLQVVLSLFKTTETRNSKQETKTENLVEDNSEEKEGVNIKEQYDGLAESNLSNFFNTKKTIHFPYSDEPTVSIILVFYNQAHLSLLCLESIAKNADVSYEVIIVDNNSNDSTIELLKALENAIIIKNEENLGFVKAVNLAARQARGRYFLLLNNDATLEPDALSRGTAVFKTQKKVGAVGGKIKLLDGSLQEAGSIIWDDGTCTGYGRNGNPDSPEFNFMRDVDYCSGAFLLTSNEMFHKLNGLDENFSPAYYEETDFCVRIKKRGFRVIYEPSVQIIHYEFASTGGLQKAKLLQAKHQKDFCSKHIAYLKTQYRNISRNIDHARFATQYPNVLIIDDRVPHPDLGAGYPRCSDILVELSKMPINVTFYPLLYTDDSWTDIHSTLPQNIEVMRALGKEGLLEHLSRREGYYQFILVSRNHNMEFFRHILTDKESLIDGVNVIYDAEALAATREIKRRALSHMPLTKEDERHLIASEIEQTSIANSVVAVSSREADIYREHGVSNVHVLGHMIEANPGDNAFDCRLGFLFVGALRDDGSPNVDSLLWFLINVFPIIEEQIPGAEFHIVGEHSAPSLLLVDKPNVLFHGKLRNIEAIYNRCRVFIAPTRFAAGIPHKVHEACEMGIPCVTSKLLAEQLQWTHEKELLIGITARDFADQCVRLHENGELWGKIRENSLQAIRRECSKEKFKDTLEQLFLK